MNVSIIMRTSSNVIEHAEPTTLNNFYFAQNMLFISERPTLYIYDIWLAWMMNSTIFKLYIFLSNNLRQTANLVTNPMHENCHCNWRENILFYQQLL